MTVIRDLAILLAQSIRKKQNRRTRFNRRQALTIIEDHINGTDEEIIDAVIKARLYVQAYGGYGFWGRSGSYFLQATEAFIHQAPYLLRHLPSEFESNENQSELAIKLLGKLMVEEIKPPSKQPKNFTTTLQHFRITVANLGSTSTDIIASAQAHQDYVHKHRFAFWRHDWKIFNKMKWFITQAKLLFKLKPAESADEPLEETKKKYAPTSRELILKGFQIRNKKYIALDKLRCDLEDEIYLLLKRHYPNTRVTTSWQMRITKIASGEKDVNDECFFQQNPQEIQHPAIKDQIEKYRQIIKISGYLNYLREKAAVQEDRGQVIFKSKKQEQTIKKEKKISPPPRPVQVEEIKANPIQEAVDPMKEALAQFDKKNEKFAQHAKDIKALQKQIKQSISQHAPMSRMLYAWNFRRTLIAQGENPDNFCFFSNYAKEINQFLDILELTEKYKKLASDPGYQNYLKQRNEILNMPPPPKPHPAVVIENKPSQAHMVKTKMKKINPRDTATYFAEKFVAAENESRLRLATLQKFNAAHQVYVDKDIKRSNLEDEIYDLLIKHHPATHAATIWHSLMTKLGNDEQELKDMSFFSRFSDLLSQPEELKDKVKEYQELLSDEQYLEYVRDRNKLANASEIDINKEYQHYRP